MCILPWRPPPRRLQKGVKERKKLLLLLKKKRNFYLNSVDVLIALKRAIVTKTVA